MLKTHINRGVGGPAAMGSLAVFGFVWFEVGRGGNRMLTKRGLLNRFGIEWLKRGISNDKAGVLNKSVPNNASNNALRLYNWKDWNAKELACNDCLKINPAIIFFITLICLSIPNPGTADVTQANNVQYLKSLLPDASDPFKDPKLLAELIRLENTVDDSDLMFEDSLTREWKYTLKPGEKQLPRHDIRYYDLNRLSWGRFTLVKEPESESGKQAMRQFRLLAQGRGGDWRSIISLLEQSEQSNDRIAGSLLGWCYLYGLGVKQRDEEAFIRFQVSLKAGEGSGHYGLGEIVRLGRMDAFEAGMKEISRMDASGEIAQSSQALELAYEQREHKRKLKAIELSKQYPERKYLPSPEDPENPHAIYLPFPKGITFAGAGWIAELLENKQNPLALVDKVAYNHYRKAANLGHAQSQYLLGYGNLLGSPISVFPKIDLKEGWGWLEKAAASGSETAMFRLYQHHSATDQTDAAIKNVASNSEKSKYWLRKAKAAGNLRAAEADALDTMYKDNQREKGLQILKELAVQFPEYPMLDRAYYSIAGEYLFRKDYTKAWEWANLGWAESGEQSPFLSYLIGKLYSYGWPGVDYDEQKAIKWWKRSWQLNDPYSEGRGISPGSSALMILGEKYAESNQPFMNINQARLWYLRAIFYERIPRGFQRLGDLCREGRMGSPDGECALKYYERVLAITNKNESYRPLRSIAMNNIGILYSHGLLGDKNREQAVKWYRKGVDLGLNLSMYNLAALYGLGKFVETDYYLCYVYAQLAWERELTDSNVQYAINFCGSKLSGKDQKSALEEAAKLNKSLPIHLNFK